MAEAADKTPADFSAVVITAPARVDMDSLDDLLHGAHELMEQLERFPGHRIIHARQIQKADSATVAELLDLSRRAYQFGFKFVICDPPKLLDNFFDIYFPGSDVQQNIFYTDRDDPKVCPVPWIPPFLQSRTGRIDIWKQGQWHASYHWTHDGLESDRRGR